MKRFFSRDTAIIFGVVVLIVLCAWCSVSASGTKSDAARDREAKEEAIYQRGYDAGYEDASDVEWLDGYEFGYDEGRYEGYDEGYAEGYSELDGAIYDAIRHARDYSEWHPEEALMVIEEYHNDTGEYTEEEYLDAIESLSCFFEYFYYDMYG